MNLPPRISRRTSRIGWDKTRPARIRGLTLQRLRARLFEESPLCVECLTANRVTAATIRDHVVPLAEGGADDDTNTQALCSTCHETKRIAEATRGLRRKRHAR